MRTSAELTELWEDMMGEGGFGTRRVWHIFLDRDGRLNPTVVPIDDLPPEPDDTFVGNLAHIMRKVLADSPGDTVAVLLSRPGPAQMTAGDRRWARVLLAAFGPELCPWPVHLATCDRVQVFAPDDLIAA